MKELKNKIVEALVSALPITAIVYVLALTPLIDLSGTELLTFTIGAVLLVLGIGLFNLGADLAMTPMGAHVGAGVEAGVASIVKGINEVLTADTDCYIALETMAGKGTEIGRTFEELAMIYDGVKYSDKLRVCFDTCHTHDAGYDIINDFDGVIEKFDRILGKKQIAVFHINDSKNVQGAAKDRHENIGFGNIGFDALNYIVHHKDFADVPKILESPYVTVSDDVAQKTLPPYLQEIRMLREGKFHADLITEIREHR